jgi:hypothetical protein
LVVKERKERGRNESREEKQEGCKGSRLKGDKSQGDNGTVVYKKSSMKF